MVWRCESELLLSPVISPSSRYLSKRLRKPGAGEELLCQSCRTASPSMSSFRISLIWSTENIRCGNWTVLGLVNHLVMCMVWKEVVLKCLKWNLFYLGQNLNNFFLSSPKLICALWLYTSLSNKEPCNFIMVLQLCNLVISSCVPHLHKSCHLA